MKLETLPGTVLRVSPGVINHHGSAHHSPAHWPRAKMMVILLALEQVSASPWTQAHSVCFPLSVIGDRAEWISVPGNPGTWPMAWQSWNVLGQLFVSSQRQSGDESHDQMT